MQSCSDPDWETVLIKGYKKRTTGTTGQRDDWKQGRLLEGTTVQRDDRRKGRSEEGTIGGRDDRRKGRSVAGTTN